MRKILKASIVALLCHASSVVYAQSDDSTIKNQSDLGDLSLEDLLSVKVQVASHEEHTLLSTPGAVTLITSEDIRSSGARDLIDVLQLVPGVSFGTDTQGTVDIGIRGNWAHEGKVLLLVDGQEMNEMFYGTLELGQHFPVDTIDRVEVIRGPGSAVYGGHAELAVINIISKSAKDSPGLHTQISRSQRKEKLAHQAGSVSYRARVGESHLLSISALAGEGQRSDRDYTDGATGDTFNMHQNSDLKPLFVNIGLSSKQLNARFILDHYHTRDRTAYGQNVSQAVDVNFDSINFGIKYTIPVSSYFDLSPEYHWREQQPWNVRDEKAKEIPALYYDKVGHEQVFRLSGSIKWIDRLSLNGGIEASQLQGEVVSGEALWSDGSKKMWINRRALYGELHWNAPWLEVTAGGRYQEQFHTGHAWVPRLALTKKMGKFHTKAIWSEGVRLPDFENINNSAGAIRPEKTKSYELELGYQFIPESILTLNLFSININDPIIYQFDGGESYANFKQTGTYGFELDWRYSPSWGRFDANYGYYTAHLPVNESYAVVHQHGQHLGLPTHKATVSATIKLGDPDLRLNSTVTYRSSKYNWDWNPYADLSSDSPMSLQKVGDQWHGSLFLEKRNIFVDGLRLGIGAFNIFNQNIKISQPYKGGHPPIPEGSREFMVRVNYKTDWT